METMRDRFISKTHAWLDQDPRLALVLADISAASFPEAQRRHPDRVINVGIREQLMISVAAGLALEGMRPIAHSYAPFLVERAYEQVKLDFGHQSAGAILVSIGASFDWAAGGRTHQCPADVALIDALPGWTIHVPGHPDEAEALLSHSLAGDDPVYVRLSLRQNRAPRRITPGKLEVVRRGAHGAVLAVGPTLDNVLAAVEDMDVTVFYAATVRPFDTATFLGALTRPDVVVVEPYLEGTSAHVISSALAHLPHRLLSIGVPRVELRRYGTAEEHEAAHGLDAKGLRARIGAFLR